MLPHLANHLSLGETTTIQFPTQAGFAERHREWPTAPKWHMIGSLHGESSMRYTVLAASLTVALCNDGLWAGESVVLYGSKSVHLQRGDTPVVDVLAGPNLNCEYYYSRPQYCLANPQEPTASLIEGISYQVACITPILGVVEISMEAYVYLLPCERNPGWVGPLEPTAGNALSAVLVPFVVGPNGWSANLTIDSEVNYGEHVGSSNCSVTLEAVDGTIWYEFNRADDANGATADSASVDLPAGSYVLRCRVEAEATAELFGFGAAEMRMSLNALIPPSGPQTPPVCSGDANADHEVNFADITKVLENWGILCN